MAKILSKENKVFLKTSLSLAVPVALQRVAANLVNLLDNVMVGELGDTAISSCSVANQFALLFQMFVGGIVGGAIIITAQAWGKKDTDVIKKTMSSSLLFSLIIALVCSFLTKANSNFIISIYTNKTYLFEPASEYLRIISLSFVPLAITSVITMILRTTGSVKLGFYVELINGIVNAFLNYCLIFGHFGMPALGLKGAGIATVIARYIGLIITIVYMYCVDKNLKYKFRYLFDLPNKSLFTTIVKTSIPIIFADSFMMLNSTFQTMITGRVSDTYIAANSIVHIVWQMAVMIEMGFENSANIMIGNTIGENKLEEAKELGKKFFYLSVAQGLLSAAIVAFIGPLFIPLYNISNATAKTTYEMMNSAALVVFVIAIQMITTRGVIRAGGKTKELMFLDILSTFCFGLPLGYCAAFIFKWPEYLVYVVIRGDYIIKAIYGIYKLKKGNWIKVLI